MNEWAPFVKNWQRARANKISVKWAHPELLKPLRNQRQGKEKLSNIMSGILVNILRKFHELKKTVLALNWI